MTSTAFDAFTRGLSRQKALAAPVSAEDRKRNKKKKNKNNSGQNKILARCVSQIPACATLVQQSCGDDAACLAARTACCDFVGACDFTGFVTCFEDVSAP